MQCQATFPIDFQEDELGAVQISLSSWSRTQWRSLFISNLHCVVSFHLYLSAGSLPFCPPTHPVINYTAHSGSFCTNNCCCTLVWHSIEFVLAVKEVYEICYYRYIAEGEYILMLQLKIQKQTVFLWSYVKDFSSYRNYSCSFIICWQCCIQIQH